MSKNIFQGKLLHSQYSPNRKIKSFDNHIKHIHSIFEKNDFHKNDSFYLSPELGCIRISVFLDPSCNFPMYWSVGHSTGMCVYDVYEKRCSERSPNEIFGIR